MKRYLIPIAGLILATGCISDNTPSTGEKVQEYLAVWMAKWNQDNGKDVQPGKLGLYILEDIPGPATADEWSKDSSYTYASVTIRTLTGTISSTNDENLAKQLGTYSPENYYGPTVFMTGDKISYAGVDAALEGMRIGGTRTVAIPAWLLTTSRYSSLDDYIEACSSENSLVYTITLEGQFDDAAVWEKERVRAYIDANYPGAQSSVMPGADSADDTFWFISDSTSFLAANRRETLATDFKINYTGSRLDGVVFDTSLERVAIDNDIYSSSKTYGPLSVVFYENWSDTKINSSSEYIDAFKAAVHKLGWEGQEATVIFTSAHGYSSTGSGNSIPAYCPLVFNLQLVK